MAEQRQEEVKKALKSAIAYYKAIVGKAPISKVRLEEVEFLKDNNSWSITLSWPDYISGELNLFSDKREYKKFIVNAETYQVEAMQIRQV